MQNNLLELFVIDTPVIEIFIRGTLMYLGVFLILRVILKREVGSVGIPDLLMVTFIADAAQNGMAGEYRTISSGLILVFTLVFWNFVLDWLSSRFQWFEKITCASPVCLVRHGRIQVKNMRSVSISRTELMALLRKEGVDKLSELKMVYLEGDGEISVIKNQS